MLFSSSVIKKQPNEREVTQDKIGVMYPPVLSLKAETSAYLFYHLKKERKKKKKKRQTSLICEVKQEASFCLPYSHE